MNDRCVELMWMKKRKAMWLNCRNATEIMELAKLCTVKNKYFDVLITQINGEKTNNDFDLYSWNASNSYNWNEIVLIMKRQNYHCCKVKNKNKT